MINKLDDVFGFHKQVLSFREQRQKVLAGNIANADTPNYKARDFDFASELAKVSSAGKANMPEARISKTSDRHFDLHSTRNLTVNSLQYRIPAQPSMDGNTVEMERERVEFADNSIRQQASLTFLKGYIHSMKLAMQRE